MSQTKEGGNDKPARDHVGGDLLSRSTVREI
jgi:hypothetical protein